jgi:phenylalanyl-tRNA synthetase beta chain
MRVPLSWLRDYVDVDLTPEQLAERLTLLGMEVKGLERWGTDWREVVVGELLTVDRHPTASRLSLTTVTVGNGETLSIVCGATNIAPGQRIPVALPGAVLPGGRAIERVEKMGVVSNGMLCSGDELRLTSDADGILILPPETPIGQPLVDLYGDVVLDVDVKPNRGDALSLVGLAREVAAATGATVRWPQTEPAEHGEPVDLLLAVDVRDEALCARFVGRWTSGVTVGPSPDHVQMRLLAAGMRPVSNVVDASNYVMLELGKPIHTFDAAAVHRDDDGRARLIVRLAEAGERLETLDHVDRELDPETLLIADPDGPLAIAGVMGGASSEVGEGTTDVIIESAIFDPISIRRTGQRYALRSEASLRFEKGQELRLARIGADRCAALIAEWAGGTVARGRVDSDPNEPAPSRLAFRPGRVNRLLGTTLQPAAQRELLARVGIETEPAAAGARIVVAAGPKPLEAPIGEDEAWVAVVPTWRRDLAIESDITEEIARVMGYEAIPSVLPHTPMPSYRPEPLQVRNAVRGALSGAGLSEIVSYALVSPRHLETFHLREPVPSASGEDALGGTPITVTNPLSRDHSLLRQGLIGSLVEIVSSNLRHGRQDVAIFEVGKGYGRDGGDVLEWWRLGLALTGAAEPPAWNRPARPFDVDDAKGLIELVCGKLGLGTPAYRPETDERLLHPGRAARVEARRGGAAGGGEAGGAAHMTGLVGELHPALVERLELRTDRVIVAELSIAGLGGGTLDPVRSVPPPRFPAVHRDLAVIVAEPRPAADVAALLQRRGGELLQDIQLFDIYRGTPLDPGVKSLAYRITFQAPDRTLTEAEVEQAIGAITAGLAEELGAHLRS